MITFVAISVIVGLLVGYKLGLDAGANKQSIAHRAKCLRVVRNKASNEISPLLLRQALVGDRPKARF